MPQIVVTIDAKTYRMACAEGEEDHLLALASDLDGRVAELRKDFGEIGDQRLTVIAAIMATDELFEARSKIARLEQSLAEIEARDDSAARSAASGKQVLIDTMNGISDAVERIAGKLERRS